MRANIPVPCSVWKLSHKYESLQRLIFVRINLLVYDYLKLCKLFLTVYELHQRYIAQSSRSVLERIEAVRLSIECTNLINCAVCVRNQQTKKSRARKVDEL